MQKLKKIVIIGGCGHVGLPLGIVFANCGLDVVLLDRDQAKIETVNAGQMPFMETNALEQLGRVVGKKLIATADPSCLRDSDAAIAVLGTPVDEHLNPTVTDLYHSIDEVIARMPENALLVLRSTVYPGVTKLVYERLQASGRKILLSFCPERIAEGKAMEEIRTLPQIISAFDPDSLARVRELFSIINEDLIELSPLEAELAKLFTNSWRYMNFAISNQFYVLAETYGLDFQRIYGAVTHRYPRMKSFAKAGFAAGPCLLKDTLQLSAFSGNNFFLGHSAMLVNEGLPNFIVNQLRQQQKLRDKVVAVLGMAFKVGIRRQAREPFLQAAKAAYGGSEGSALHRPLRASIESWSRWRRPCERADVIILGAPHAAYRDLPIPDDKVVVDVWGFWPNRHQTATGGKLAS